MSTTDTDNNSSNKHSRCCCYRSATASRKYLLFGVLCVLLTFPQASEESLFKFGGSDGDTENDDASASDAAVAGRKQIKVVERKFKFRKIERIRSADDEENDNNDSGNDDNGDNDSNNDDNISRYNNDNDDDDEDDDTDKNNMKSRRESRREAASSHANEHEEFQFERVRRAYKEQPRNVREKPRKVSKSKRIKDNNDDEDEDESGTNDQGSDEKSESTIGSFLSGIFGFGSDDDPKKSDDKSDEKKRDTFSEKKSNSIIDWLKWMGEKSGRLKPEPLPQDTSAETWLSYFDRWPFNSLFPIGKPPKPIRMPHAKRSTKGQKKPKNANANNGDADDDDDSEEPAVAPPMSEAHFESLLHTLPGFVVNASHVADVECRQQMQIFHRQLRGNKLWTLQMLDATGKITAGLLRGNINQFGDFELCMQVKTMVHVGSEIPMRIRGKYCLAHIETQTDVPELKLPLHLAHGRGLWNSHLGNPSHFVPRYAVANWGVCIPNMCSGAVVQEMIETNLRPYNTTGVEFNVEVEDDPDCYMRQSKKLTRVLQKNKKLGATILFIATLSLVVLVTLFYEHWTALKEFLLSGLKSTKSEEEEEQTLENTDTTETSAVEEIEENGSEKTAEPDVDEETTAIDEDIKTETTEQPTDTSLAYLAQEVFKSFSPTRTFNELLAQDRLDLKFPIFHVLKLGATFMLYICFKYLMIGHLPIVNRDKLVRAVDQPFSVVFRAPMIYTDILLLISGFLSAYQLSAEMEQKSSIQLLKRVAAKIARYLPTVYVVLIFQTWILPHLGAGPLWSNLIGQNARICEHEMWRNIFSVQNAIAFEETCSPMTIQLAVEVQLYLLGPLIVWLYYTDSDAGFFIYGALHAMSVAARYARTNSEHLSMTLFHGMNVSKFYRTANILYSSPLSRATPYLIGIGAGLLHRSQQGSLEIAPGLLPVGWAAAILSLFWCFWSPSAGMRSDFIYSTSDAANYASWSPLILGLALFWMIFMFPISENSIVRFLTSSRPVLLLSRIAFPIQLCMYVVVMYNTASVKDSLKYHVTDLVNFNEIVTILVFATILAFVIDIPSQNIRRLLVNRLFIERPHREQESEPISGAEQSESEAADDHSEQVTADTPEPTDTVWASDPEEEEQKYIARRRSSTVVTETESTESEAPVTTETNTDAEQDETEEEEEEEETDIAEEDEVKKRPETPPPPVKEDNEEAASSYRRRRAVTPPSVVEEEKPTPVSRRRRPTTDD